MNDIKTHVQFQGGPYDGLGFFTSCAQQSLAAVAELPVSQDVLWALNGKLLRRRAKVSTVASYAAIPQATEVAYRFISLRQVRPEELPALDSWCSYVIRSEAVRIDHTAEDTSD